MATATKRKALRQMVEPAVPSPANDTTATTPPAWLTLEFVLYGLIFLLAVALRFWQLGAYPLNSVEAQPALAALALYLGQPIEAQLYSPLLLTLNALSFLLFDHSDATVRIGPALLGSSLALLPLLLRRRLGPTATLTAATLLAISPTAVFLSRTLNGEIATALGAMLLLAGFFNWTATGQQGWLYTQAAGLATLLTSGPMAYSVLIIFALLVLVQWKAIKSLSKQALAQMGDTNNKEVQTLPTGLKRAIIFFAVLLLLLATAGMLNLSGFGVTTSLFTDWISRFSLTPRADAAFSSVFLLTIYEPLLLIAGIIGATYAILSKDLLRQSLATWFFSALILDVALAGRPAGSVLLTVVPLALLAGLALGHLWDSLAAHGRWSNEGIILAAGLVIFSFGTIGLTGWLVRPCGPDDTLCHYAWLQSAAALGLFVVIVAFFWFIHGAGVALRGTALTGVVIGVIAAFSIGWRLNYGPLMHLAYQPLAGVPASTELVALADTLKSESLIRTGDEAMLDIATVNVTDPALLWQLRHFKRLSPTASLLTAPGATAIITPVNETGDTNLGEAYLGQDFALESAWSPVGLNAKDLLTWLIYRQLPTAPGGQRVILWFSLAPRG